MDSLKAESSNNNSCVVQIAERSLEVKSKIQDAARRSGRMENDVLLVAVSKYADVDDGIVDGFLRNSLYDLAENRPQKFLTKAEFWSRSSQWNARDSQIFVPARNRKDSFLSALRWHFIGNLQRNKARRILPYVSLIHSVDSWKLLEALERILDEEHEKAGTSTEFPEKISVLLEVHISDDATKQGFSFDELERVLPRAFELNRVQIRGLMGMAGLNVSEDETRRQFVKLRETLEYFQKNCPDRNSFCELSMGMSSDFEIAIEEGSTIVRVGSSLYPSEN